MPEWSENRYLHFCFDQFQAALEKQFLNFFNPVYPEIMGAGFYYRASIHDQFTEILKSILPIVLIFATFYAVNNIIKVSN